MVVFGRRGKNSSAAPQFAILTYDQMVWQKGSLTEARKIAKHYTGQSERPPSIDRLESCVTAWQAERDSWPYPDGFINAISYAFADQVARDARLIWATSPERPDIVQLYARIGRFFIDPLDAVTTRLKAGETGFISSLHASMVADAKNRNALDNAAK